MAAQAPVPLGSGGTPRAATSTAGTYGRGQVDDRGLMGGTMFGGNYYRPGTAAGDIPDAEEMRRRLEREAAAAGQRGPASMNAATINTGQADAARAQQASLVAGLTNAAAGVGPSAAQTQLKRAEESNLAQALAMSNNARGASSALAQRDAAFTRAAVSGQAGSASAELAAQEQQAARAQLAGVLQGMRGQDAELAMSQAQLQQQASGQNLQADIQQRQLNDQRTQFYVQQGLTLAQARQRAALDLEQLRVQQSLGENQIQAGSFDSAANRQQQIASGFMEMAGSVFGSFF